MSESTTDIAQASRKPMHIGSYRVIGKIGQGGMGTVYKAIQTSIDRIVALKVLAPHLARDAQFVDRFLREARSAARLSHRNLVCVYDCGEQVLPARRADGTDGERTVYYFSMEYVEGCTLGEWVQRHGLPDEHDGLGLMRKLAVVLGYAHERNLVHRDVKPDNILIDAEGEPRLCDLGLAKPIDALVAADDDAATNRHDPARIDAGLTQVGTTLGTPRYMAPEQVTRAQIDGRTDLYALAATFFHVFTGRPLFVGDDGQSVGRMHLDRPPTPIRQLRKEFSRETEALLLEMLAKRPDRRPADAATVAARIDRIRAGAARAPGRGQPRPGARGPGRARRERSRGATPVIITIVAVLAIGLGAIALLDNDAAPRATKPSPAEAAPGPETETGPEAPTDQAAALERLTDSYRSVRREQPADFATATQRLARLAALGAAGRERAHSLRAELEADWDAHAQARWQELEAEAATLVAADRYDAALAVLAGMPRSLAERIPQTIAARQTAIRQAGETALLAALDRCEHALADGDPTTAAQALQSSRSIACADARTQHQDRLTTLDRRVSEARRRGGDTPGQPGGVRETRPEAWTPVATRLVAALLGQGKNDYRSVLDDEARQAESAIADLLTAAEAVAAADTRLREHLAERSRSQATGPVSIATTTAGERTGEFADAGAAGIQLSIRVAAGEASGHGVLRVAWEELTPAELATRLTGWQAREPAAAVATAALQLRCGAIDAAARSAQACAEHPLGAALAQQIAAAEAAALGAQAQGAWQALLERVPREPTPAEATALLSELARWRAEHGQSPFAEAEASAIVAVDQRLRDALTANLVANGDFEDRDSQNWRLETMRGSEVSVTRQAQAGEFALRATTPNRARARQRIYQTVAVAPDRPCSFSAWVCCHTGETTVTVRLDGPGVHWSARTSKRDWKHLTTSFTPTSDKVLLVFEGTARGIADFTIDSVAIHPDAP